MDTNQIVSELKARRDSLTRAIDALNGLGSHTNSQRNQQPSQGRSKWTAARKAKLARAMRAHWKERRKKQKGQ